MAALLIGVSWSDRGSEGVLRADPQNPFADADDDFLPDMVEWAVLTNPQRPDTDSDGVPDFVEVVQRGSPRRALTPLPQDHELRTVVTATNSNGVSQTWLHLMFRFMGTTALVSNFRAWVQIGPAPGLRISLEALGNGPLVVRQRQVPAEGLWVTVSLPMVSEEVLRLLLPCTIAAEGNLGGRQVQSAVQLFDIANATATLVPNEDRFAVQTIRPGALFQGGGGNKICVLELTETGSSPAGTIYLVTDADCDDCNELECGVGCTETTGWVFLIPGGTESITGG